MNIEEFTESYTPEPNSGCWLWTRGANDRGYGSINRINYRGSAHRLAWRLFKGDIPAGMCVLHQCDTPACVNPQHLFIGTHAQNMQDRNLKGRSRGASGEKNSHAKLTIEQVEAIRQSNATCVELSKRFGVSNGHISLIRSNKKWEQDQ